MAKYRILQTFNGSQDGRFTNAFEAGTEAELSDYLVSCVPAEWVEAVSPIAPENKAIITSETRQRGRPKANV